MYCRNCGTENRDDSQFCVNCGSDLSQSETYDNVSSENKADGLSIASLVLGIVSMTIFLPLGIVGFILGIVSKKKTGIRTAGIVLNSIALALVALIIAFILAIPGLKEAIGEGWNEIFNEERSTSTDTWTYTDDDDYDDDSKSSSKSVDLQKKENGEVVIYFFRGEGCPHCEEAEEWFKSIEAEYGNMFKIKDYETWYNEDNADFMDRVAKSRGESADGVPYIIIGDKSWKGFTSSYEDEMLEEIKKAYNE